MRQFIAEPTAALAEDSRLLPELILAWGNSGWIAQEEYLRACMVTAMSSRGATLECGSGLSTLLLGVIAQQRGYEHWALEHLSDWRTRVDRFLVRYHITAVRLCLAPMKRYRGFEWYTPPFAELPREFKLVVCDGPPADTFGGRYGLVPVMRHHLAPGCVILLDDASRKQERAIARRWQGHLNSDNQLFDGEKPYMRILVPGRH